MIKKYRDKQIRQDKANHKRFQDENDNDCYHEDFCKECGFCKKCDCRCDFENDPMEGTDIIISDDLDKY